ncbi:metallophosphoesterase [Curtobacterium flaccumfaciens]|uniref:metallophosphoesterase n=1 Tax=Curtobacterium flaccumfaciens TaxID=2035 RepID=UPI003996861F
MLDKDRYGSRTPQAHLALTSDERRAWPTQTGAPSVDFTYGSERRVALVGDWESQGPPVFTEIAEIRKQYPDVSTLLHVGDLRWQAPIRLNGRLTYRHDGFLPKLESELARLRMRIILTPGNHEDWTILAPAFAAHPERPRRLSPSIWVLPRGFRFQISGRSFLSFGRAVSVDADRGSLEAPTDADVSHAVEHGKVDVLLTHEPPNAGIGEVKDIITHSHRWASSRLLLSASSRRRIDTLVAAVTPQLTVHGHMHVAGRIRSAAGAETVSLAAITKPGNVAILELATLDVTTMGQTRLDPPPNAEPVRGGTP